MSDKESYIYGRNPVIEALNSDRNIEKIFLAFGVQGDSINRIHALAKKNRVQAVYYDKKKFSQLEKQVCQIPFKSQGVIALLRDFDTFGIEDVVGQAFEKSTKPIIVILDEISDPQNLGAIARSAECSGAVGIILSERNSAPLSPVAIKASAGALEHLPVCKVSSFPQAFEFLKNNDFWIIGADAEGEKLYSENIYDSPIAIVIGSEGGGLRPSTKTHCDLLVRIPIIGNVSSLNASVTAGIILFEIVRQRSQ